MQQDFIYSVHGRGEDVGRKGGNVSYGLNFSWMHAEVIQNKLKKKHFFSSQIPLYLN